MSNAEPRHTAQHDAPDESAGLVLALMVLFLLTAVVVLTS